MSELQKRIFDAATRELCAAVMEHEGADIRTAMKIVYGSKLYAQLSDVETGLYREGPVYLYDMLCEERGMRSPRL